MRYVVTGVGDDGRSKVMETRDVLTGQWVERANDVVVGSSTFDMLWASDHLPPDVPPCTERGAALLDTGIGETGAGWLLASFGPRRESQFHRTDTVDFDLVVSGEVTLVLEDGEILLRAGDAALVPGVVHAWRGGAGGYTLAIFLLGLPPRE